MATPPSPNDFILMGGVSIAVGCYGVLAPYRWNVLRLKQRWARHLSASTNAKIPKVIGGGLIAAGLLLVGRGLMG